MTDVSAYIPCYNGQSTLAQAIKSVKNQSVPVKELIVIDDGSQDASIEIARSAGVKVIALDRNHGRGFVRAVAMREVQNEFVLCCDSGQEICFDFLEKALSEFNNAKVAAVRGHFTQKRIQTLSQRWAARHIYHSDRKFEASCNAPFITSAAVVRKSIVMKLGNYNECLRHSEDLDMGQRIYAAGFLVAFNPELLSYSLREESPLSVLERFWRWNRGIENSNWSLGHLRDINYALKVMVPEDLKAGDIGAASLSLISPYYRLWKSWKQMK